MAKTFSFTVPVTGVGQSDPVTVNMYQSDTLVGAKTLLDTSTLAALGYTSTPPETLMWAIAAADGTKYYWLAFVSADGVEGQLAYLGPQVTLGSIILEAWTETAIGVVVAGAKFRATPVRKGAGVAGTKTIVLRGEDVTDVNGYASLNLYADSGIYLVELVGYSSIHFDTTGKSGETINYASEL